MTAQTTLHPMSYAKQPESAADDMKLAEEKQDANGRTSAAQFAGAGMLIAAVAIILGVFGAGFMRTRVERGFRHLFRRLADSAENIDIPLLLPLTLVETLLELLADRRIMVRQSVE